jgi:hypothetical protein
MRNDMQKRVAVAGPQLFDRTLLFDEKALIEGVLPYLSRQIGVKQLTVEEATDGVKKAGELGEAGSQQGYDAKLIEQAEPGDCKSKSRPSTYG